MTISSLLANPTASREVQHTARVAPQYEPSRVDKDRLGAINRVVRESVDTWAVSERVRRLALPSLLYSEADLPHMRFLLLDDSQGNVVAAAAWEDIENKVATRDAGSVQLHGLYVLPHWQGQGLGSSLLEFVGLWAGTHGFEGTIVRAWRESDSFFRLHGFEPISQPQSSLDSSRLLWKPTQWLH